MKIGIITIHFGVNYGSALQSYALSLFLKNHGFEAEVIDYIPNRYGPRNYLLTTGHQFNLVQKALFICAAFPFRFYNRYVFRRFSRKYLPLSRHYATYDELEAFAQDYDFYITGSDQVWNRDYNGEHQKAYYLTFAPEDRPKIAYAASFGRSKLESEEVNEVGPLLHRLQDISVREDSALPILDQCQAKGMHVLDPVFLLSRQDWQTFSAPRPVQEKYVFIYALGRDYERPIELASQIAEHLQCKVVISTFYRKTRHPKLDHCLTYKDPHDFVSMIYHAEHVVTNSFHGIAFSINLNKQFTPLGTESYNSRLESILSITQLKDRLVNLTDDLHLGKALTPVDYRKVNWLLEKHKNISKQFILGALHRNIHPEARLRP
jgi:hypothetical protein